jgi:soluble lytic murein transglycosylase-like protein
MKPTRQRRTFLTLSALLGGLIFVHLSIAMAATQERPDEEMRDTLIKAIESSDSFKDRYDAEVWLTDMSNRLQNRVKDPIERLTILKTVHYEAQRAELDPELVLAVIDVESRYDRFAISSAGAQGLMQIMPFWLDEIGHPEDNLFVVSTNIRLGCTILKYYLNMEKGNLSRALARYNGSLGKYWYPKLVFNALSSRWYKQ